jgi:hypothetical protein
VRRFVYFFAKFIAEGAINERKNKQIDHASLGKAAKKCAKPRYNKALMSSLSTSQCCLLGYLSSEAESKIVCNVTNRQVSVFVLTLIGAAFIGTGLYLYLGGIGTVPTLIGGTGLLLAGVAALFLAGFRCCHPE